MRGENRISFNTNSSLYGTCIFCQKSWVLKSMLCKSNFSLFKNMQNQVMNLRFQPSDKLARILFTTQSTHSLPTIMASENMINHIK